jgi:hypothetical protein
MRCATVISVVSKYPEVNDAGKVVPEPATFVVPAMLIVIEPFEYDPYADTSKILLVRTSSVDFPTNVSVDVMTTGGVSTRSQYSVARFTDFNLQLFNTTNQLTFGGGRDIDPLGNLFYPTTVLNVVQPTASRTVNIPASTNSDIILSVVDSGSQTINGTTTCFNIIITGQINLPTAGGTVAALNYFENAYTLTTFWVLSGATGTTPISTVLYFSRIGNMVTMIFPQMANTPGGSGSGFYTNFTLLPSRYWPSSTAGNFGVVVRCSNGGGAYAAGLCSVRTNGAIEFNPTLVAGSVFGTTGTNTIWAFSASWLV